MALPSPSAEPSVPPASKSDALRSFFLRSVSGYLILGGAALKLIVFGLVSAGVRASEGIQLVSSIGGLALVVGVGVVLYRLAQFARHRLLWRVRRKLIVSYLLIGLVPAILIVTFFVLLGWLLFTNLSSYLIRSSLADMANQASAIARSVALEIEHAPDASAGESAVTQRQAAIQSALPGVSVAVVPTSADRCVGDPAQPTARSESARKGAVPATRRSAFRTGSWGHVDPPAQLPAWVSCDGFSGALTYETIDASDPSGRVAQLAIRAVAFADDAPGFGVVVDVPILEGIKRRIEASTGIAMGSISVEEPAGMTANGRARATPVTSRTDLGTGLAAPVPSVAVFDVYDWHTGTTRSASMSIGMSVQGIYHRLSLTQASTGRATFNDLLAYMVLVVLTLFFIIEVGAAAAGMSLARSITGSVHELFTGTERVRQGDFGHRIAVLAKDQLGDLADSFNLMTGSIEDLLRQSAEKKRLEEEMRLAREIQMSLLPRGPLEIPGMTVAAACVPAREVGGDYYDILPLPDGRVGLLIADVSGKGMSAALYMAELKGLILSLSQIHSSPRDLLITANRLISEHLDSRSFITMTYAVIEPATRTMTYARAGHTPLLYVPQGDGDRRTANILVPDGMVLGLRLDNGERFESLLVESTIHLAAGDLLVFFTDGISEAMNDQADCFGEPRLGQLIEEHAHLPLDELRERILREIDAFVGGAPQHDDMTLILVDARGDKANEQVHG